MKRKLGWLDPGWKGFQRFPAAPQRDEWGVSAHPSLYAFPGSPPRDSGQATPTRQLPRAHLFRSCGVSITPTMCREAGREAGFLPSLTKVKCVSYSFVQVHPLSPTMSGYARFALGLRPRCPGTWWGVRPEASGPIPGEAGMVGSGAVTCMLVLVGSMRVA